MPRPRRKKKRDPSKGDPLPVGVGYRNPVGVRIVGGKFRGRRLDYGGDFGVRPMKDRVREAVFNLIGPTVRDTHVVDLFAGTGALAFEAMSRGAVGATLIERHAPTSRVIRKNIETLNIADQCDLIVTSAFSWASRKPSLPERPWTVFCCPPYRFFTEREEETLNLIQSLIDRAPEESIFIVESDKDFNHDLLPYAEYWKRRTYPPAEVGVWYKRDDLMGIEEEDDEIESE